MTSWGKGLKAAEPDLEGKGRDSSAGWEREGRFGDGSGRWARTRSPRTLQAMVKSLAFFKYNAKPWVRVEAGLIYVLRFFFFFFFFFFFGVGWGGFVGPRLGV